MADTHTEDCMHAAKPTEHHERMEPFAGTFKARVSLWMEPGEPNVSTGVMTSEWKLNNLFLRQRYDDDSGMFSGEGYWGYNTTKSVYEGLWVDVMATFFQLETGTLDASGKVWTMKGEGEMPGMGRYAKRSVITLIDDDHHTMESYMAMGGKPEQKILSIEYTRAK